MSLVELHAIHKSFGELEVLKGIDLSIDEGQVIALIGKSGSGKSTLLRTINGLEVIDDGVIIVDGKKISDRDADLLGLRLQVGMVFQQFNLFPHYTALENVMLSPQVVKKQSKAESRQIAEEMLAKVGLADKMMHYPDQLSGGQQQRVAIAVHWR